MRSVTTASRRTHWAVAGAVAFAALTGCGAQSESMPSATSPVPAIDATMHIVDCGFQPPIVFAHPGDPVTIVNLDSVAHRLTGQGLPTVSIPGGGGAYSFQAPDSGTTTYNCDHKAAAKGQVFVL